MYGLKIRSRIRLKDAIAKNFAANELHRFTFVFTFSVVIVNLPTDCVLSFLLTFSFQSFPSQQTSSSWTSSWFLSSLLCHERQHFFSFLAQFCFRSADFGFREFHLFLIAICLSNCVGSLWPSPTIKRSSEFWNTFLKLFWQIGGWQAAKCVLEGFRSLYIKDNFLVSSCAFVYNCV